MRKIFSKILALVGICAVLFVLKTYGQQHNDRGFIVSIGSELPPFEMTLTDGTKVHTEDLKDKVVLLQFTASWCKVCREEMPHIEKEIWAPYKDKDLVVIGIDLDEPLEKVQEFAKDMNITYPLALDPGGEIFKKIARWKSGVTRNVLVDKAGNINFLTRLFDRDEFGELKERIHQLVEA